MGRTSATATAAWLARLLPLAAALLGVIGLVLATRPTATWLSGGLVLVAVVTEAAGWRRITAERWRAVTVATCAGALAAAAIIAAMATVAPSGIDPRVAQR